MLTIPSQIVDVIKNTSFARATSDEIAACTKALRELGVLVDETMKKGAKHGDQFLSLKMTKDFKELATSIKDDCVRRVRFAVTSMTSKFFVSQNAKKSKGEEIAPMSELHNVLAAYVPLVEELGTSSDDIVDSYFNTSDQLRKSQIEEALQIATKGLESAMFISPSIDFIRRRNRAPVPVQGKPLELVIAPPTPQTSLDPDQEQESFTRTTMGGLYLIIKAIIDALKDDEQVVRKLFISEHSKEKYKSVTETRSETILTFIHKALEKIPDIGLIALHRAISLAHDNIEVSPDFSENPILKETLLSKLDASAKIVVEKFKNYTKTLKPKSETLPSSIYRTSVPSYALKCAAVMAWCLDAAIRKYPMIFISKNNRDKLAQDCIPFQTESPAAIAINTIKNILTYTPKATSERDTKHGAKYFQAHLIQCLYPTIFVLGPDNALPTSLITVSMSNLKLKKNLEETPLSSLLNLYNGAVSTYAEKQIGKSSNSLGKFLLFADTVKAQIDRGDHPETIKLLQDLSVEKMKSVAGNVSASYIVKLAKDIWARIERQFPLSESNTSPLITAMHSELISQMWNSTSEYFSQRYNNAIDLLTKCYGTPGEGHKWNVLRAKIATESFRTKKEQKLETFGQNKKSQHFN